MHIKHAMLLLFNLQVRKVIYIGGPAPTTVWALSCNTYTVSGDNPSIVCINTLLPKPVILVPLYSIEYCVIIPLRISGGLHLMVTLLEATATISNDWGSLGTANKFSSIS